MSDLETPNMPDAPDPAEAEARLIGWRPALSSTFIKPRIC